MKHIALIIILSILSIAINSCTTSKSEDVADARREVNEANQNLIDAEKAYKKDVDNYRAEISADIKANKLLIAQMKAENTGTDKAVILEQERKINELEIRNSALNTKLNNYKGEDKEAWYNFKKELKHDMHELGNSFKDVSKNNVADKK